jgi:hypothetical protein
MANNESKAIVVAVPEYDFWTPLPTARSSAARLAEGLCRHGYVLNQRDVLDGGEHHHLGATVREWLRRGLHELSINMFPEDGCLRVYGVGEDGVPAFTEYGIECARGGLPGCIKS